MFFKGLLRRLVETMKKKFLKEKLRKGNLKVDFLVFLEHLQCFEGTGNPPEESREETTTDGAVHE